MNILLVKAFSIAYALLNILSETNMRTINVTKARADLYNLLIETSESHEPIQITGKKSNAILVSEEDWRAIQETIYLLSIPGMRESIIEGMDSDVDSDSKELDW